MRRAVAVRLPGCCRSQFRRNLSRRYSSQFIKRSVIVATAAAAAVSSSCMMVSPPSASSTAAAFVVSSTGARTVTSQRHRAGEAPQTTSLASQMGDLGSSLEEMQINEREVKQQGALNTLASTTVAAATSSDPVSGTEVSVEPLPSTNSQAPKSINKNKFSYSRIVYGSDDALFGCIESQQLRRGRGRPFGSVLDAGTGLHSIRWLASLHQDSEKYGLTEVVGVTADMNMQKSVQREVDALGLGDGTNIVIGNWFDATHPLTFPPESFDTILADYLIGAMDGFSPYRQDQMIPKLCQFLKPGGTLYVVGMEPIPDSVVPSTNPANIICRVRQVRDACILLAGHRCYREYPVEWMVRHLREMCGNDLDEVESFRFPILYRYETVKKQIEVGRSKLPLLPSALRDGMEATLNDLDRECQQACRNVVAGGGNREMASTPTKRISLGFDYVVSATKRSK